VSAKAQPAAPPRDAAPTQAAADAAAFLEAAISDTAHPVVLFALEWCEFCWSVRKMFKAFGIAYRSIDLDSVEYQADDRGGQIRLALNARFGIKTIPQVFVGGELVGGATDLFDSWRAGRLQALLEEKGVDYDRAIDTDPYTLLPGWLHKR
jgi:cysteine synthase A